MISDRIKIRVARYIRLRLFHIRDCDEDRKRELYNKIQIAVAFVARQAVYRLSCGSRNVSSCWYWVFAAVKNRRSYDFIPKIETFIVNDDFANKSQLPKAGLRPTDANFKLQLKDEYPVKKFIFGILLAFFTSSSNCRTRLAKSFLKEKAAKVREVVIWRGLTQSTMVPTSVLTFNQ